MKILIPLAVVLGLIGAIVTFQKFFPSRGGDETKQKPTTDSSRREEAVKTSEDKEQPKIQFLFQESNPILSKKDSPYSSPEADYKPERATKEGFTVKAVDGVALVQHDNDKVKYIITDTGRNKHKIATIYGYTSNPYRIYADCEESHENDPYSRLDGIFVGKTVSTGYVIQATPQKCIIRRIDGGKTYITFNKAESKSKKAEGKEELEKPYIENIQPPQVPSSEQGGIPPLSRRD
jgi:hypothetical protein